MNFDYTDDQQAMKSTAHDFLAARYKPEKLRELAEAGEYDDAIWKEIAELGWPGIFIEESHGGQELGQVELTIVQEELGYALAPTPFFSNAAAGLAIVHAGSDEQRDRWLPGIASGEERGTVGVVRDGFAPLVPDADTATVVVLIENGGATAYSAGDLQVERADTIDSTRRFFRVEANGGGESLDGDVGSAWQRIEIALA